MESFLDDGHERGSNAYSATWPGRPWRRGVCASSIRSGFPSRSKRLGRMARAIFYSLRWTYWRSWQLWSPAPVSSPALPQGPGPSVPGIAAASCPPSRSKSRRRWTAIQALRPAAIAWVFAAELNGYPAPADRGRPDRSYLDPGYLEGGGRPAVPTQDTPAAAVRVRRLTSSAIRSLRREPYGGVCPQVLG